MPNKLSDNSDNSDNNVMIEKESFLDLKNEYTGGNILASEPLVCTFDNFLSDDEIDAFKAAALPKMQRAFVSAEKKGVTSPGRTGSNCWVLHTEQVKIKAVAQRISSLVDIPLINAESFQVIHYGETQQYKPHFDGWDHQTERGLRCMAKSGQRLITCLIYLNDVEEGGGTIFPKLDKQVEAKKGRLVIFHNCEAGTNVRHPSSLHGGMPVTKGEKWACNLWFREDACR